MVTSQYLNYTPKPNGRANAAKTKRKPVAPAPIETRADRSREAAQRRRRDFWKLRKKLMRSEAYLSLTLRETRLLHALLVHADGDGRCHPSLRTLAEYVIPSYKPGDPAPSAVMHARDALIERGLIVVEQEAHGRGNATRYRVLLPERSATDDDLSTTEKVGGGRHGKVGARGQERSAAGDNKVGHGRRHKSQGRTSRKSHRRQDPARDDDCLDFVSSNGSTKKKKKKQTGKKLSKRELGVVEAVLTCGVKSRRLVEKVLADEGIGFLQDLLRLAEKKHGAVGSLGAYLGKLLADPESFDREPFRAEERQWRREKQLAEENRELAQLAAELDGQAKRRKREFAAELDGTADEQRKPEAKREPKPKRRTAAERFRDLELAELDRCPCGGVLCGNSCRKCGGVVSTAADRWQ